MLYFLSGKNLHEYPRRLRMPADFPSACLGILVGLLICKLVESIFPKKEPPTADPPDHLPRLSLADAAARQWHREHRKDPLRFPASECRLCRQYGAAATDAALGIGAPVTLDDLPEGWL